MKSRSISHFYRGRDETTLRWQQKTTDEDFKDENEKTTAVREPRDCLRATQVDGSWQHRRAPRRWLLSPALNVYDYDDLRLSCRPSYCETSSLTGLACPPRQEIQTESCSDHGMCWRGRCADCSVLYVSGGGTERKIGGCTVYVLRYRYFLLPSACQSGQHQLRRLHLQPTLRLVTWISLMTFCAFSELSRTGRLVSTLLWHLPSLHTRLSLHQGFPSFS